MKGKYLPVFTSKPPAPPRLLQVIRCNCKGDCSNKTCSCIKYSLKYSTICGNCRGLSCQNRFPIVNQMESDIDDDDDKEDEYY